MMIISRRICNLVGREGGGLSSGLWSIVHVDVKVKKNIHHGRVPIISVVHAVDIVIMGISG